MVNGDRVSLDQLNMHYNYDLTNLYNEDFEDDEINDSPYFMVI
jgi:hypothetical protein